MNTQPAYAPGQLPVWTFADKIRKARDLTGDNQREFAARIDVNPSSLAAYETGRSEPRFRDAQALSKRLQLATGIPAWWFLTVDDPNTGNEKKAPTPKGEGRKLPELDSNQQPAGIKPLAPVTHLKPRAAQPAERPQLAPVHAISSRR